MSYLREWRDSLIVKESTAADNTDRGTPVVDIMDYYWKTKRVRQVTFDGYADLRKHLEHPALDMGIKELEPTYVQTWINAKLEDGVGEPTIRKAFDQLSYACRWGVRMRQLKSNPATQSHHQRRHIVTQTRLTRIASRP